MASIAGALFVMLISVVGGLLFVFWFLTYLKAHRLVIRDPLSKDSYVAINLMREKKNKDTGNMEWHAVWWQPKLVIEEPPKESIDITPRGRKLAEAYRITEDQFVWIVDRGIKIKKELNPKTGKIKIQMYDVDSKGNMRFVDSLKPFTTIQREVTINQYTKAQNKRNKRWTTEKIMAVGAIAIMALVIVMFMIMWGDIVEPVRASQDRAQQAEMKALQILERIAELEAGRLTDKPQVFPPQQGGGIVQPGEEPPTDG